MEDSISINKFISDTGYCSRREADELIKAGRVLLNGRPAKPGNRYKPGDELEVDGSLITRRQKEKPVYMLLNKPVGITTTTEENVAGNIISFVGYPKRIFPIGRLDKDSEGLIILTNDGDIVNKVLRAGNSHEKEYDVRVNKPIGEGFVSQMEGGIPMLGTVTLPCKVRITGKQRFTIILTQGLNRQIRRMCEYLGYEVTSLRRTRIMHLKIDNLATGKWRYLSEPELVRLKESIQDSSAQAAKNKPVKGETREGKSLSIKGDKTHTGKGAATKSAAPAQGKAAASGRNNSSKANSPAAKSSAGKSSAAKSSAGKSAKKQEAPKGSYKAFRDKGRKR